jgi:uncharacterized membrane protein YeiH
MNLPSFPNVDLFSAGINALNGVLVACNPSHNRGYTAAGLLIMAFFGGIGGGMVRDLLLNELPSPLKNPVYLVVCLFRELRDATWPISRSIGQTMLLFPWIVAP